MAMRYCFDPACSDPNARSANAQSANAQSTSAQFCAHCGMQLQLADRYQATARVGHRQFSQTFIATDAQVQSRCVIRQAPVSPLDRAPLPVEFLRRSCAALGQSQHPQMAPLLAWFSQQGQ
ncbi:MAG: hypothetical protein ACFB5Z_17605 [Elainellaceae cyanobacterium]